MQRGLWVLFPSILLMALAIAVVLPVLPALVHKIHMEEMSAVGQNSSAMQADEVLFVGILFSTHALLEFIFAPTLGKLSDRFGRRPIIILSLCGESCDLFLMTVSPRLWILLIGRVVAGCTNGIFGAISASIADLSSIEDRSQNFALIGLGFGLSFILGPGVGGVLGEVNIRLPFAASLAITILNLIYVIFFLPESLPPEARTWVPAQSCNPCAPLGPFLHDRLLLGVGVAVFFFGLAFNGMIATWVKFTEFQFHWKSFENGMFLSVLGIVTVLIQGFLIRLVVPHRLSDRAAALICSALMALSFFMWSMAASVLDLYSCLLVFCVGYVASPVSQSIASRRVESKDQGKLQGAYQSVSTLTRVLGPLFSAVTLEHYQTKSHFPGAAFLMGGVFLAVSTVVLGFTFMTTPDDSSSTASSPTSSSSSSLQRSLSGGVGGGGSDKSVVPCAGGGTTQRVTARDRDRDSASDDEHVGERSSLLASAAV